MLLSSPGELPATTGSAASSGGRVRISVMMPDGRSLAFFVTVKSDRKACFALGIRKSGSSVFSNIVTALAGHNGANVLDIPGTLFQEGYETDDWRSHCELNELLWNGNVYVGFRDAPTVFFDDPIFKAGSKILVVRDPRDALVSEYFSNAYSHSLPARNAGGSSISIERARALATSIDEYVLARAGALDETLRNYEPILGDAKVVVLRYEDVIHDKRQWIARIAEHFGLDAPSELVDQILGWADVRPESEDPRAFIRRVTPGDHLEKLAPDTIRQVEQRLSHIWSELGYEIG